MSDSPVGLHALLYGSLARKADDLSAMCELLVCEMLEPRRLTVLWASTTCYRDNFAFIARILVHCSYITLLGESYMNLTILWDFFPWAKCRDGILC
jgi:hypothetical protein